MLIWLRSMSFTRNYISKEFRSGRIFDIEIFASNAEPIYFVPDNV